MLKFKKKKLNKEWTHPSSISQPLEFGYDVMLYIRIKRMLKDEDIFKQIDDQIKRKDNRNSNKNRKWVQNFEQVELLLSY